VARGRYRRGLTQPDDNGVAPGIVRSEDGVFYAVYAANNAWGFSLHDGNMEYPGGCGAGTKWFRVLDTHVVPGPLRTRLIEAIQTCSKEAVSRQRKLGLAEVPV